MYRVNVFSVASFEGRSNFGKTTDSYKDDAYMNRK